MKQHNMSDTFLIINQEITMSDRNFSTKKQPINVTLKEITYNIVIRFTTMKIVGLRR
jgi:hypothetical protein